MPVLCDMKVIQGDAAKVVGDADSLWRKSFNTGGRTASGDAIIMLMVRGLTDSPSDVPVYVNDKRVGAIGRYQGGEASHWHTQIINIGAGVLRDGNNTLEIRAVAAADPSSRNLYDDFVIKDVVCFFQQSA